MASDLVTLIDDPLIARAPGSRTHDGEGLPSRRTEVVGAGTLRSYLLDRYSARKLGMEGTHSASRGGASVSSSTSNFILQPGSISAQDLVQDEALEASIYHLTY